MSYRIVRSALPLLVAGAVLALPVQASEAIAKKARCIACHAVDKKMVGPAYRDVAAKYKDKDRAESVQRLVTHMTSGEKAKFPDGHEEAHKKIKTKDVDKQKNLAEWILSLPGGKWPPK